MASNCPIIGITPLHRPDGRLAVALMKAGVWAVVDVGNDKGPAFEALAQASAHARKTPAARFGVRAHREGLLQPHELPPEVRLVVLPGGSNPGLWRGRDERQVFAQVTSSDEAIEARAAGFDALIAVGNESGGRVSQESAFLLLQRLMQSIDIPVWVQGGIGLHTAAACFAGGASGVVIDSQLALVKESTLEAEIRHAIRVMDGTETTVIANRRVFSRPDLPLVERARREDADEVDSLLGGRDLRSQLLPLGQDAAFASLFAERFGTARGVIQAIQSSTRRHLIRARDKEVLGRRSALALDHGTEFPIVQGPMTRVSDRASFAEAVAEGGALPFLALALMRGGPVLELLEETAERMSGRSWGVGILGFVPPELRAEQLEAIEKVAPPFVIIAGGRPSQARRLEARGSVVYLHVPSPELLRLFHKEGARRFIFEGRECGGHVGPRTSFALWESQIELLLGLDHPEELSVLFAGGIHDDRSGAMVSAMAASLAARGVRVGVLLGTAYLFTKEIVSSGALRAEYQKMVCECDGTVLLETAPGHSTRCIGNEYVAAFEAEKKRLMEEGKSGAEVWAELEKLNLGRLRLAAKGLRREKDALLEVDDSQLRREGMFMVGGIAALRDSLTTVGELHQNICDGAAAHLARIELEPEPRAIPEPADVAIIGMACLFPKAPDLETFWSNIVQGVDAVTEVPKTRWNPDIYYDPKGKPGLTTPSKWGGFLEKVPFDPGANGIPPNSMAAIEPVQLLSLYVARKALADAGYEARDFERSRTSVIFGAESGSELTAAHGFRALFQQYVGTLPPELDEVLPLPTEDTFPGLLANVIAGRISNRLDLGGKNFTVDAACASSLAAVDVAIQSLVSGSSDMVVVGGADTHNSINDYLMFSSVHALSPTGRCRSFDHKADGIVLGEGVGAVVLKLLSDAERDGDRIYAVLKGLAGSSDGKSLGLTAPRKEGQARAIQNALDQSGIDPGRVGLIEAHGTGTVVGDRTELESMSSVFSSIGKTRPASCALGSVKSQIGHTKSAAGIASLIKSALCLYHRVIPPTLHIEEPNPAWDSAQSPFYFTDRALPWVDNGRRIAGVSAFGFGGTNFHAVLEEPSEIEPERASTLAVWPAELFLFRGNERAEALRRIQALLGLTEGGSSWSLRDLARSTSTGGRGPVQVAVVARDRDELLNRLTRASRFEEDLKGVFVRPGRPLDGKLAFLFPGQGSQRLYMLSDLFVAFPMLGELLCLGERWAGRIWPRLAYTEKERQQRKAAITDTRTAQPALGLVNLAMFRVLKRLSLVPEMMAGHSYGELAALSAAGCIAPADLFRLSEARAEAMVSASTDDPGTMAAVSSSAPEIAGVIAEIPGVTLANHNSPRQTVISGPTTSMKSAVERLRAEGFTVAELSVACAFHSEVVAPARSRFADALEQISLAPSETTVYANSTARPYPRGDLAELRRLLTEQIASPVLFMEEIEHMYDAGARVFVEVGPGAVLSNLTKEILDGRPKLIVNTDAKGQSGLRQLQMALAQLAVHDVAFDVDALYQDRNAERFDIERPPRNELSPLTWFVNGHRAWPATGPLPASAMRPVLSPPVELVPRTSAGVIPKGGPQEIAVLEYLRNLREIVEAQRQVMLSYLGNPVPRVERAIDVSPPAEVVVDALVPASPAPLAIVPAKSVTETLLSIVSERTGYPIEMLELTLDLEADLGIDSIKRVEILGALNETLGIAAPEDDESTGAFEELVAIKTLQGIIDWTKRLQASDDDVQKRDRGSDSDSPRPALLPAFQAKEIGRYSLRLEATASPVPRQSDLENRSFGIVEDDRQIAHEVGRLLTEHGAQVRLLKPNGKFDHVDHLIDLTPLSTRPDPDRVKKFFKIVQQAVASGSTGILAATAMGGDFGRTANGHGMPQAGYSGFLKSLAKERPDIHLRAVDFVPSETACRMATLLLAELSAEDGELEVGYRNGVRQVVKVVRDAVHPAVCARETLGRDSVVLITGGARGITSRVTLALAERFGCTLELVGRTARPTETTIPELEAVSDLVSLKRVLIARGEATSPAAVDKLARRLLVEREIRNTLRAVESTGCSYSYHSLDVRDRRAFGALIDDIYRRHGRIDAVVHGAGVIEDKLLPQKSKSSFDRVFDTKVRSAQTLAEKLRGDVRYVVFFSSISSVFGNRGQTDYAAANDFLDKLAHHLNQQWEGHVLSINWGPWDAPGMVSAELRREYQRRGVPLISPDDGVDCLLREMFSGQTDHAQVVLMVAGRGDDGLDP